MTKRLFIFASWDKNAIVDDTVVYYVRILSELGDIVFIMDNDTMEYELDKIRPFTIYASADRHSEYDFGSYKRGYAWALNNDILKNYDWVYLVNDSVYGPLRPLKPILEDLESHDADIVGMFYAWNPYNTEYLQSWFIGIAQTVAMSDWFSAFLHSIRPLKNKFDVIYQYEFGLSKLLREQNCKLNYFMSGDEKDDCFRNPLLTLQRGMPFIKKSPQALSHIKSESKIRKYVSSELLRLFKYNMRRNSLSFGRYFNTCEFRLFGVIPLITVNKRVDGNKFKLMLLKIIPIISVRFYPKESNDSNR